MQIKVESKADRRTSERVGKGTLCQRKTTQQTQSSHNLSKFEMEYF